MLEQLGRSIVASERVAERRTVTCLLVERTLVNQEQKVKDIVALSGCSEASNTSSVHVKKTASSRRALFVRLFVVRVIFFDWKQICSDSK